MHGQNRVKFHDDPQLHTVERAANMLASQPWLMLVTDGAEDSTLLNVQVTRQAAEIRRRIDTPPGKAVHHIDGDRTNNHPDNLRIVDLPDRGDTHETRR